MYISALFFLSASEKSLYLSKYVSNVFNSEAVLRTFAFFFFLFSFCVFSELNLFKSLKKFGYKKILWFGRKVIKSFTITIIFVKTIFTVLYYSDLLYILCVGSSFSSDLQNLFDLWYCYFAMSVCAFNSLPKDEYSNLFIVAPFLARLFMVKHLNQSKIHIYQHFVWFSH